MSNSRITQALLGKQTAAQPSDFFPRVPPLHDGELRNSAPRPFDSFARPIAEALSPTMGGYGMGQLTGDTAMRASEGDWQGVAGNAMPLMAMAMPLPGAKSMKFDWTPGGGHRVANVGKTELSYGVSKNTYGEPTAELILIKTPKAERGQGHARTALQEFLADADANGVRVFLNSDPMDKGVSKPRLDRFYEGAGFKKNTGRNKDFSSRAEYVREPKKRP
jgi:hypothetical protein